MNDDVNKIKELIENYNIDKLRRTFKEKKIILDATIK